MTGYFDIKRDNETIATGGFWCEACLTGKPLDDRSPDPRYCLSCFNFLKHEAEMLPPGKRPAWVAKSTRSQISGKKSIPIHNGAKGIMQHKKRGRPEKPGEVHRVTDWRRRKKELQGVLI